MADSRIAVVVPMTLSDEFINAIRDVDERIDVLAVPTDGPVPDGATGATVFFRSYAFKPETVDAVVERARALRWMHVPAAGVDVAMTPNVLERDFVITNVAGVYDTPVAELALALMMAAAKRLPAYLSAQREGRWLRAASWDEVKQEKTLPTVLREATATLVGLGGTGGTLAGMLKALGMRVIAVRHNPRPDPSADEVHGPNRLHEALRQADYVVLTLPLTNETRGIIGARELAQMKATAWLINVGRGGLVDDDALIKALESGEIAGACLDLFSEEPLPADHPYYRLPNVIVTPHIAGAFPEINEIDREYFVAQLRRFVKGEPLKAVIDRAKQY